MRRRLGSICKRKRRRERDDEIWGSEFGKGDPLSAYLPISYMFFAVEVALDMHPVALTVRVVLIFQVILPLHCQFSLQSFISSLTIS